MRFFITSSLVVLLMVACTEEKNPVMDLSPPAGKQVAASQQELVIAWDCGASKPWTIFYKNHRFLLGTSSTPLVTEYLDSGKRKRYEAASVWDAQGDRASAVWMQANGKCVLRSNRITEADVVRIYAAEVNRDALGRYYLQQDGESFLINRRYVNSDGELTPPIDVFWHRDFADLSNRDDPRPDGLTSIRDQRAHLYYLPWNIDLEALLEALEALGEMPKDDRALLLPAFAEGYSAFLEYEDSSLEQDGRTDTNDELTALESVASDSLYCRDADLWTEYCTTFGNLPNGGCDAIANCGGALLGASSVMAIVSDTAWVQFNPADYGWIRFPLSTSGSGRDVSFQRWVHPKYSGWGDASLYGDPAPPELIGLVKYPYRPLGGMKVTLYGFPCEGKNCAWGTSSSSSPVIASPVDSEPTDKVVVGGVDEGVENTGQVEGGESKPPVANTPPAAGVSTATSPGNPTPVSSTAAEGAQSPPSTDPPVVQGSSSSTDPPVVQGSSSSTDPPVVQGSSSSTDPPVVQGSSSSTDPPVVQGSSSSTDPPVVQEQEEVSGRGGGSENQERYGPASPEAYIQYFRNSPPVPCTGNTGRFTNDTAVGIRDGKINPAASYYRSFNTEVREKLLFYHGVEVERDENGNPVLDENGNPVPKLDENGDPIQSQMCVPCCEFPNSYTDYLEGTRDEFIAEMNRRFPVPPGISSGQAGESNCRPDANWTGSGINPCDGIFYCNGITQAQARDARTSEQVSKGIWFICNGKNTATGTDDEWTEQGGRSACYGAAGGGGWPTLAPAVKAEMQRLKRARNLHVTERVVWQRWREAGCPDDFQAGFFHTSSNPRYVDSDGNAVTTSSGRTPTRADLIDQGALETIRVENPGRIEQRWSGNIVAGEEIKERPHAIFTIHRSCTTPGNPPTYPSVNRCEQRYGLKIDYIVSFDADSGEGNDQYSSLTAGFGAGNSFTQHSFRCPGAGTVKLSLRSNDTSHYLINQSGRTATVRCTAP